MVQTRVIVEDNVRDLQGMVNAVLERLQHEGARILDIKFSMAMFGDTLRSYGVLVVYATQGWDRVGR